MDARLRAGVLGMLVFCAAVLSCPWRPAAAEGWPERTVRFISPVSAGTAQDTSLRLVADRLTQSLGRSFIVDNTPGGRGLIAAQTAARAEPDGYTYFLGGVGVIAADRHLYKSLPYNPDRDFVPVAMIYDASAFVVAVHPDVPAQSVPELITLAKSQPGKLSYGTGTVGVLVTPGLWFNKLAGTELVAVPYNNSAQMMQDAVAGRTQVLFTTIGAVEPFRRAAKLRVLGVSSSKRFPGWEQVPTIAETLPGYDIVGIGILMAPTGTPAAVLQRLNREVERIVKDQDFIQRLNGLGMTTTGAGTPESLVAFMRAQRENWDRMFSYVHIEPQ
jgi:tripartite-type tricarboxylate transporter receptor subunit TctC